VRVVLTVFVLWLLPAFAAAQSRAVVVICLADKAPAITLDLWRQSVFGVELHCIDANFITGMTPCAPDSGFGLSDQDSGRMTSTTASEADAYANIGGLTYVRFAPLTIEFWGGQSDGSGDAPLRDWTYTVDRVSGVALLLRDDKRTVYTCGVIR
jgi:hypothetical protein